MSDKPIPEGFHTVTPCLIVEGAEQLIEFIEKTFDGRVKFKMPTDNGKIAHAEVVIGDSILMLGDACEEWKPTQSTFYLYVDDADAIYRKALEAGAVSFREPKDQFYGDRNATVKDAFGNFWTMATHLEEVSEEELEKRAQQAAG